MNINVSRVTLKMTSYNYVVPTVATKSIVAAAVRMPTSRRWPNRSRLVPILKRHNATV